ncbi:MAG: hypothetical protein WCF59_02110 [Desulfobaccales bacterium]
MHPILVCWLLAILYIIPLGLNLYQLNFPSLITVLLIVSGFGGSFAVYYFQVYKPINKKNEEYLNSIFEIIFSALDSELIEIRPENNNIRINIMQVRRKKLKCWERYLRIEYCYGDYDQSEVDQIYGLDTGCCGVALYENSQIFYDSILQHEAIRRMTPTQRRITEHVKSTLSTPIYSSRDIMRRTPVAILNLDSGDGIDVTGFNGPPIQEIAAKFATLIGGQF